MRTAGANIGQHWQLMISVQTQGSCFINLHKKGINLMSIIFYHSGVMIKLNRKRLITKQSDARVILQIVKVTSVLALYSRG